MHVLNFFTHFKQYIKVSFNYWLGRKYDSFSADDKKDILIYFLKWVLKLSINNIFVKLILLIQRC